MTQWRFSRSKKVAVSFTTALFLFLWSMTPASGADRNVICDSGGCAGFDNALFANTGASPGDSVTKSFTIKNNKDEKLEVSLITTKNSGTDDSFLDRIGVIVYRNSSDILFSGSMDSFFNNNSISLGSIDPGKEGSYEIQISLSADTGNDHQGKRVNFTLSLNITGQATNNSEVLGASTSSTSGSAGSAPSNSNSIIGQVLGLSDTSGGVYKVFFTILGIILLFEGFGIISSRRDI